MQPEIQYVASSELCTVTIRLNICLRRSTSNKCLVIPVTDLDVIRNCKLMYGVGINTNGTQREGICDVKKRTGFH